MLLNKALGRGYKVAKDIKVFEVPALYSMSGISATIFGATGFIGNAVAPHLGVIGSDLILPSREKMWYTDRVKMLRLSAPVGYTYVNHHTNFQDPHTIRRLVEKSNVVINCAGPRSRYIRPERFKEVNIDLAARVARQARLAGVKRLIHFSSVGVDPNSPSLDLATKWEGEQRVREEFPDATILRPTTVVGQDDYFVRLFRQKATFFDRFVPVFSDMTAKRQPILVQDVARIVLSVIKQTETMGQTYEIGGPHVYTLKEFYDIMAHAIVRPLTYAKIDPEVALIFAKAINYDHFNAEMIRKEQMDLVVGTAPGTKTVEDLCFQPASVVPQVEEDISRWRGIPFVTKDEHQR